MPVKKQRVRVEVNEIPVEKPKDGMGDASASVGKWEELKKWEDFYRVGMNSLMMMMMMMWWWCHHDDVIMMILGYIVNIAPSILIS